MNVSLMYRLITICAIAAAAVSIVFLVFNIIYLIRIWLEDRKKYKHFRIIVNGKDITRKWLK
jgi:hypothetical protein